VPFEADMGNQGQIDPELRGQIAAAYAKLLKYRQSQFDTARSLYPGSYRVEDYSIVIDTSMPELSQQIVLLHELVHADLGQHHYGEMICRMESFGRQLIVPLNELRGRLIAEVVEKKPERPVELKKRLMGLKKIATDGRLRKRIRARLVSDPIFMAGARYLDRVITRKDLLLPCWIMAQEGGAYWIALRSFERFSEQLDDPTRSAALELARATREKILRATDANGEGMRMVQAIAERWGKGKRDITNIDGKGTIGEST